MLYLMRHGQTEWNKQFRIQGMSNIPLNDAGIEMAREAAERYADVNIDICYSSPLIRARDTACIFMEGRGIPVITDERLSEMDFGKYDGTGGGELYPGHPVHTFLYDPAHYEPEEDGESFEELYARIADFLNDKVRPELLSGKDVLIVGHGSVNLCIKTILEKRPLSEFWTGVMHNCEITAFAGDILSEPANGHIIY